MPMEFVILKVQLPTQPILTNGQATVVDESTRHIQLGTPLSGTVLTMKAGRFGRAWDAPKQRGQVANVEMDTNRPRWSNCQVFTPVLRQTAR